MSPSVRTRKVVSIRDEIKKIIEKSDGITSTEIKETMPFSKKTVQRRLKELLMSGEIELRFNPAKGKLNYFINKKPKRKDQDIALQGLGLPSVNR